MEELLEQIEKVTQDKKLILSVDTNERTGKQQKSKTDGRFRDQSTNEN